METKARTGRYTFRPASVSNLERRDVPSGGMSANLRNLSATVVGDAARSVADATDPADRRVVFAGAGKDQAGRPVRLMGSLVTYDPQSYAYIPRTTGTATLVTRRGAYHFNLDGPRSDLEATSGTTNVTFGVTRHRPAPNRIGVVRPLRLIARGSMQVHREPGLNGGEEFTATITIQSPVRGRL